MSIIGILLYKVRILENILFRFELQKKNSDKHLILTIRGKCEILSNVNINFFNNHWPMAKIQNTTTEYYDTTNQIFLKRKR